MPNTIAQNLQRLQVARTDIANAITEMGGTVNTGDGFEAFPADILTIPTGGGSEEITGTISGDSVGTGSIAKRFGDIVIIYISYNTSFYVTYTSSTNPKTGTFGTVSGLVTTDEFNNKTDILAVSKLNSAGGRSGYQGESFGGFITVTTSCSNNIISVKYSAYGWPSNTYYLYGVSCVVAFKV